MDSLTYKLQAIVKETSRLHPIGPFLVPRKVDADMEILGFTVPKGAQVLVNAYAIGRDSSLWAYPDLFMPERFLESDVDFKGKHFELIRGGRRICPGMPLANRMVHPMLASLVHNFDWEVEDEGGGKGIAVDDKFGLAVQKAKPLRALPIRHRSN